MLSLPLESAGRLLQLLLHLLLHLLLRPEALLLMAATAAVWAAARHGPTLRCLLPSLSRAFRHFVSSSSSSPGRTGHAHHPGPARDGHAPQPCHAPPPVPGPAPGAPPRVSWQYRCGRVAAFALQGRREHMEDRFTVVHRGARPQEGPEAGPQQHGHAPRRHAPRRHALYGVFDGHGGEAAAELVKRRVPELLRRRLAEGAGGEAALRDAVRRAEHALMHTLAPAGNEAGTTCVLALELGGRLLVANVGDSRAVLCDAAGAAVALSHDHKPHQLKERQRIKRAGGFISYNGSWRVQGVLAMSRSLGDFPLKRAGVVTAEPDVTSLELRRARPRFLLLASDGLWDAFGSQEAVSFVAARLAEPHLGAKSVAMQAYYRGCPDNITVIVVKYGGGGGGAARDVRTAC